MKLKFRHCTSKENALNIVKTGIISGCATPSKGRAYQYGSHCIEMDRNVTLLSWFLYQIYRLKWVLTGDNSHAFFYEIMYENKKLERFRLFETNGNYYPDFWSRVLNKRISLPIK